jgi:hypothetical protein
VMVIPETWAVSSNSSYCIIHMTTFESGKLNTSINIRNHCSSKQCCTCQCRHLTFHRRRCEPITPIQHGHVLLKYIYQVLCLCASFLYMVYKSIRTYNGEKMVNYDSKYNCQYHLCASYKFIFNRVLITS